MSSSYSESATAPAQPNGGRRAVSVVILILAVIALAIGALTAWLRTQVFDTDVWVETSRETLQEPEVRTAVATWTVDEVFAKTNPDELLQKALPDQLDILAAPIVARLQTEAYDLAERALADPRVEELWVAANRRAHTRFVRIIEGDEPIVVETIGGVQLDLRPLLENVAERIGLDPAIVEKIPDRITTVTPKRSEEAERAIKILRAIERWGGWITFIGFGFLALGIWLAPNRRRAWMWTGGAVIVASFAMNWVMEWLGPQVALALSESSTWRAAVLATWDELTLGFGDSTTAGVIIGIVTIALAWITGPAGLARSMRQSVAPIVKDRELAFAAVGAALALILVNWIDVLASRRTGVQLFLIAGLAGAFWAYARTATRELADTTGVANEPVDAGEATVVKQESE